MTDFHTWVKDLPGIIKSYWVLIPMFFAAFGGLGTGGYHWLDKTDVQENANKAIHEVAAGFQKAITEIKPKSIVIKSTCSKCSGYFEKIVDKKINEYNTHHIDKTH